MKKASIFLESSFGKNSLLVIVMSCYSVVMGLFMQKSPINNYPLSWVYQFYIILAFSILASIIMFTVKLKGNAIVSLFAIQFLCKYLLTKPFGENIWFEFFLIIVLLMEGVLLLTPLESFVLTGFIILSSIMTGHSGVFWGNVKGDRPISLHIFLIILTILLSGLSMIIKTGFIKLKRQNNLIDDQNNIIRKLATANAGFQQYANLAEEESINSERMRITREIHDTVGYTMTNLLMMLEASTDLVGKDSEKLEKLLRQSLEVIKDGHKEMRHSLRILRNTKVKETNSIESINNIIKVFRDSTGVDVRVELGNIPWNLSPEVDNIIFRFLQEGMTNSLTHGDAKKINIHFWFNNDTIYINLVDDGNGCQDIKQGIGLKGMEERLQKVSGKLNYHNIHDGFSIKLEIPWKVDE